MGCVNIVVAGPETVTSVTSDYISLVTQSKLTCMQKQEIKFDVSPLGNQASLMCVHLVNVTYMKRCACMYLANDVYHWQ